MEKCVTTDDNGLYYMRQRYYNPEIKRFVNQDVLTGNISNSQSLNRYSYVQGNPVSYTDPFGLSPLSGMFEGTALAHGILGVLGCIPGIGGAVFNAIDAWVYYYYDKDYFMATMSGISALSLGFGSIGKWAGKAASYAAKGSKAGRAFQYLSLSGNFLSNGLEFVQNGIQAGVVGYGMWNKYVVGDAEMGWYTVGEVAGFSLSLMGCAASGMNMSQSGKQFSKMLKEDNVSGRIKQGFQKLAGDNHGWSPAGGDLLAKAAGGKSGKPTRRQSFRQAKEAAGIPNSAQYKHHEFVYDGSTENRIVYEFEVNGKSKYVIEHPFDKNGRGNHFHGADDKYGSPYNKGTYNQYDGHFPEDFDGFE